MLLLSWLAAGYTYTPIYTENGFTYLGGTFHDIKTVYVLGLIPYHNLRVSGRGSRVYFSGSTPFRCHQDEERCLRMEVRRKTCLPDFLLSDFNFRAFYLDGVLVDSKSKEKSEPRPCAGNDGTTITVKHQR